MKHGLIIYIPSIYTGETQKNWVSHQTTWSHHLKYHLYLKTKEDGIGRGSVMGGYHKGGGGEPKKNSKKG